MRKLRSGLRSIRHSTVRVVGNPSQPMVILEALVRVLGSRMVEVLLGVAVD